MSALNAASAASRRSAGTRTVSGRTPSNDSPYSSAPSAPRSATASTMGRTFGTTESTSTPPRGSAARNWATERVTPRRSMRAIAAGRDTFTLTIVPEQAKSVMEA